jgi:hypothetical protein
MFKSFKVDNARRVEFEDSFVQIPKSKWAYLRGLKFYGNADGVASSFNTVVCGKNIFNPAVNFIGTAGVGWSKSGEVYTLKIISPITDFFVGRNQLLSNVKLKPLTSYMFTFVCTRNTADINLVMANLTDAVFANTATVLFAAGQTGTKTIAVNTRDFTSTTHTYGFYLQGYGSQDAGEWDIQMQLEEGSTATPYQSYNGQTYPYRLEDTDGNLHTLGDGDYYDRDNNIAVIDGDTYNIKPYSPTFLYNQKPVQVEGDVCNVFTDATAQPIMKFKAVSY